MRARALLVESSRAIATVVEASEFASISQFYAQFKAGYGLWAVACGPARAISADGVALGAIFCP